MRGGCRTAPLETAAPLRNILRITPAPPIEHDSRKIVKRLVAEGWEHVSTKGSHHKFRRGAVTVIVPHPKKDLPTGAARAIGRPVGWP
jgi:predicted RNA binding protein YcfA (HicA-like mRNA interferase family)